jgi:archaellum component FlaC
MSEEKYVSQQEHEFVHHTILDQLQKTEKNLNGLGERVTKLEQDLVRVQERDESQWKMIGKLEAKIDVLLAKIEELSKKSVRIWEAVILGLLGTIIGSLVTVIVRVWTKGV